MAGTKRRIEKFYVVWEGHQPGIYTSWPETLRQVEGYGRAKYKSFESREQAEAAFRGYYWDHAGKPAAPARTVAELESLGVNLDAVAVDAACAGTPGPMEYRGVLIRTGEQLFQAGPFEEGTNNAGEFLAIVHALALLKQRDQPDTPIYSDSQIARAWIRKRTCRTNLQPTPRNKRIFELLTRAVMWLKENPVTNPILVWKTEEWGEIPADYGRK
jgi:ribonuclease HI